MVWSAVLERRESLPAKWCPHGRAALYAKHARAWALPTTRLIPSRNLEAAVTLELLELLLGCWAADHPPVMRVAMTHGNAENAELRLWDRERALRQRPTPGSERGLRQLGPPSRAHLPPSSPNQSYLAPM